MRAVYLPGDRTVEILEVPEPRPGHGQVLVAVQASTICGSDLRAIYREHLGTGPEAYQGVIAGHEPCGVVVEVGPGCRRAQVGDRVIIYHIAGCGLCDDCRAGYQISCTSPYRAAYGWQRDGGHAELLVADETTLIPLPDELSAVDGACVACGFGTAFEGLSRVEVSGRDAVLVTGLGPVGLAAGLLARALGAHLVVGADVRPERRAFAVETGAVDQALPVDDGTVEEVRGLTGGHGCEVSIDCSGATAARSMALSATRRWGRCALVGEGNRLEVDVSGALIHRALTIHASWVTSIGRMAELTRLLVAWDLHPERTVSDRFALSEADRAYHVADTTAAGKVALIPSP